VTEHDHTLVSHGPTGRRTRRKGATVTERDAVLVSRGRTRRQGARP
jgi:hypothetical protein